MARISKHAGNTGVQRLGVCLLALLCASSLPAQTRLSFESRVNAGGDGEAVIVNKSKAPIVAYFFAVNREPCSPMEAEVHVYAGYDAGATADGQAIRLFESRSQNIGGSWCNKDASRSPAKASLKAALFADGTTFGDTQWVAMLMRNRGSLVQTIDGAIRSLQQDCKGRTREECVAALENARAATRAVDGPKIEFYDAADPYETAIRQLNGDGSAPLDSRIEGAPAVLQVLRGRILNELPRAR